MHRRSRHLARLPAAWGFALLAGWLPGVLAPGPAGGAGLSVSLQPGIAQKRDHDRPGHWSRQWVRSLPPDNQPYLMIVQGPDAWLEEPGRPGTVTEVAARNEEQAAVLRAAMAGQGLLDDADPLLLAGRLAALLRVVETEGKVPAHRYREVWLLWEVLADAAHADTLSVAIASLQVLHGLGVEARLVRYPTAGTYFAYGVLVPDTATGGVPWAVPVAADALIPAALSVPPVADLRPSEVTSWEWAEILAPGWSPSLADEPVAPTPAPEPTIPSLVLDAADLPDLCSQALALDLECVSADPRRQRETTLAAISAAVMLILAGCMVLVYRRRRQRLERVSALQEIKRRNGF